MWQRFKLSTIFTLLLSARPFAGDDDTSKRNRPHKLPRAADERHHIASGDPAQARLDNLQQSEEGEVHGDKRSVADAP